MEPDKITEEQQKAALARVDAVSQEAFELALDSMFDLAIQRALVHRSMRETDARP